MGFYRRMTALLLLVSALPGAAAPTEWQLIGERTVARGAVRESIQARPIVYASHLRLCADRQDIRFGDLDILYRNGREQRLNVQALIPAGRCTPDLALSNVGERDIDRVVLSFQTAADAPQAPRIYVFALAGIVLR